MPLYTFHCRSCNARFSKITSKTMSSCPECSQACEKDLPEPVLIDTPTNASRKLAKQMSEKTQSLKQRRGI